MDLAARWEEGRKHRYDCGILTGLMRAQVPVLDFVEWYIDDLAPGRAHSVLPLNSPSTNQHCTHQAALLFLAADYTGGLTLGTLVSDWPVVGIHPVAPGEKALALWLVKGEIKFLRPSVGRLDIEAEVDPERFERILKRFDQGKPVIETVTVRFRNGTVDVAEAVVTYFGRESDRLRADGVAPDKVNILYQHKLVSSAEMIAGVRAREHGGLFEDPFAAQIAGEHGLALAGRFCERSPQIGGMVAARTRHLDDQIRAFVHNGGRDLVLLGAGYDLRPFRLDLPEGMCVYEVDFPTVLADRQRRLNEMGLADPPGVRRIPVALDLRTMPLAAALSGLADDTAPLFVAWEGMSMYFDEAEVRAILGGIAPVLKNNRSRLWFDYVDERAIRNPEILPEVAAFLEGMQLLGEPFVFGTTSVETFMESNEYRCLEVVSSDVFLPASTDPIYALYRFCVATAADEVAAVPDAPSAPLWVAHGSHEPTPAAPQHDVPSITPITPK